MKILVLAVVLCAFAVTSVGLQQAPIYEASAEVRSTAALEIAPASLDSRAAAKETIRGLQLQSEASPAELTNNLSVERSGPRYTLAYEDTDPVRATRIVNTVAKVSSSEASAKLVVASLAAIPAEPVSPNPLRNGLLTLVVGLALIGVWAIVGRRRL